MTESTRTTVGIIGAGVTGLTAANILAQKNYKVTVLEKAASIGGLAREVPFINTRMERYYHFICKHDAALLGLIRQLHLDDKLKWRRTAMDYHVNGVLYPFTDPPDLLRFTPLSLFNRLRFAASMIPFQRKLDWKRLDSVPHDVWLRKWGGDSVYEMIWKPLMVKKYHSRYKEIPAAWVWGRTRRRSRSRRGFPGHEYLGYLEGGTHTLFRALIGIIESHGGTIRTGNAVSAIRQVKGGFQVTTDHKTHFFNKIISTIPCPELAACTPGFPDRFLARLNSVEYLAVICPVIAVDGPLAREYWTNIFETEIPYLGVIQFSKLNPDPGFMGLSVAYMPFYVWPDNPLWSSDDDRIMALAEKHLKKMFPWFDPKQVKTSLVHRDRYSQPMIRLGHIQRMLSFRTPWPGLFLTDASMIYPEDRGLNNCIRMANRLTEKYF